MKLSLKLPLAFGVAVVLLFIAGLFGISSLTRAVGVYEHDVGRYVIANKQAAALSTDFAIAIQEWKNVLIRGKNPQDLEKYWSAHSKKMQQVIADVTTLQGMVQEGAGKTQVNQLATVLLSAQAHE
jgi:hypothetical protein